MCHKCGGQKFTETFKRVSIQSHIVEQYLREIHPIRKIRREEPAVKAIIEFATWFNNNNFEV
jgi:hypothetical protein